MERIGFLIIVISAILPVLAAQECPDGYTWHDGQCYFLSEGKDSWDEAARDCERRGAELAVIEDSDTDTFLHTIFKPCPYWISRESEEDYVDELNPADNLFKYVCQAPVDDDLFCEALGGVCQDESIACALHYVSYKCGGPPSRKCCLGRDAKCENGCGGVCQPNKLSCSVNYYSGKCGGGNDRECCVPADFPCIEFCKGTCQDVSIPCPYPMMYFDRKCGGPENRKCCAEPLKGAETTPAPEVTTPKPTSITPPGGVTPPVNPPDDTECEDDCGGVCQSSDLYCPIPYYKGKCSGDRTRLCCVPADEPCVIYCNGVCQKTECELPNVWHDNKCGGPSNRRCCAPPNPTDDHPNDNPESCGPCKDDRRRKKRIVNVDGDNAADPGEWPWQVQVRSSALLCLDHDPSLEEFEFTDSIQPICLPSRDPPPGIPTDGQLMVTGWGDTTCCYTNCHGTCRPRGKCTSKISDRKDCSCPGEEVICCLDDPEEDPHPLAPELQELPVYIPNGDCDMEYIGGGYIKTVTDKMICGEYFKDFQSTGSGDSGGPLSWKPEGADCWVLAGIVSWGPCADGPDAFTRVTQFTDWITEVTGVEVTDCDAAGNN